MLNLVKKNLPVVGNSNSISIKAARVLALAGVLLFAILLRVWYLAIAKHEEYHEKARKPQRRTVVEHIGRASIRDRFNIPLAINKMQFNVAVRYADIRQIPSVRWEVDGTGKRVRMAVRTKYIEKLAKILEQELGVKAQEIEDTIHAKASLMPHVPFTIAEHLSEQQYYRLRMMEKDWPGIVALRTSQRHYPKGKTACDVLGMMGAISAEEYLKLVEQLAELEDYVARREAGETPFLPKGFESPIEVRERLIELRQKAYSLRDLVGKSGIEAAFDQELRGLSGKRLYEVDVKGNIVRQLPLALQPLPGKRVILTISSELQEYAEELLAQAEVRRCKKGGSLAEPWIKGGAIVAMDAKTGEVLTLASYPRFDPRDFIPFSASKMSSVEKGRILEWLESEERVAEIWDGHAPLKKEGVYAENIYRQEELMLSWETFLEATIPKEGDLRRFFDEAESLNQIIAYQEVYLKQRTKDQSDEDGYLAADLCRLVVRSEELTPRLKEKLAYVRCKDFFSERQAYLRFHRKLEDFARKIHSKTLFQEWRERQFKQFLKEKRREEKQEHLYPKPYTDYIEQMKKTLFQDFWNRMHLVYAEALLTKDDRLEQIPFFSEIKEGIQESLEKDPDLQRLIQRLPTLTHRERKALLKSFKGFQELKIPLLGKYSRLRRGKDQMMLQGLASAFYPLNGFGFGRSQAFRQSTPAGSVFKMGIAYQGLFERYEKFKEENWSFNDLNPLTLIDESPQKAMASTAVFGRTNEGKAITRLYKGGRLPRSSHAGIGKVDLIGAIEQSSNIYFSILASEHIKNPQALSDLAHQLGYGEKSGIELPGEIPGKVPNDLSEDLSALYAYAIGQHSTVVTPLQTAVMIGAFAGEGKVLKPSIIQLKAGQEIGQDSGELFENTHFAYQEELAEIGVHFPLFTLSEAKRELASVSYSPIQIRRSLFYPKEIRDHLLEGMKRAIQGSRGTARPSAVRPACSSEKIYRVYQNTAPRLAGKTGTAEILYKHTIDKMTKATLRKHTWFAGVSFAKDVQGQVDWNDPQVIVVVYLRFAEAGREAAPLAALMVQKWEEICQKYGSSSYVRPPLDDQMH
jgi:cell division protein FtsI/penicillin-binding protein 2